MRKLYTLHWSENEMYTFCNILNGDPGNKCLLPENCSYPNCNDLSTELSFAKSRKNCGCCSMSLNEIRSSKGFQPFGPLDRKDTFLERMENAYSRRETLSESATTIENSLKFNLLWWGRFRTFMHKWNELTVIEDLLYIKMAKAWNPYHILLWHCTNLMK